MIYCRGRAAEAVAGFAAAVLVYAGCNARGSGGITASVVQQIHPVLIRNERNSLLEVVVNSKQSTPGNVQGMEFALIGTDDLGDLESLEVYYTAPGPDSAAIRFGEPARPASRISFRGSQPLHAGDNVFVLSCKLKPSADLSHKAGAAVTSIATQEGALNIAGPNGCAPRRIGTALRKHNDDGVHTYRIPSLATGPKGTLYAVYDMRRRMSRDLQEDIDTGLSRSVDGGRTWEPPRVIMDMGEYGNLPQEQNGVSDPGIIVDEKTGEIFVFAVWMWGKPGKHQWTGDGSEPGFEIGKSAQILMVRSKDDGLTWSKPENLTRKLKKAEWWLIAPSPQQGINLKDGTLVLPAQGRDEKGVPFATIMISRDHGATWKVGSPAFSGGNECQAAELGDGLIMLNMRNDHERYRAVYITRDLGQTWSPHKTNRNTLIEPNCNASLRRIGYHEGGADRHVLLFANPRSQTARVNQTIQVSLDDGRTWPQSYGLVLDEGKGRGYPSISPVDESHIGIVYEGSQADLTFEKIALSELLRH
jgi:sialidase-1